MLGLGKKQTLKMVKQVEFGVYLADGQGEKSEDRVLLPKKQVPRDLKIGDSIEVFLYKDSSDRLIATTNTPRLLVGEVGKLRVSQCTAIGAFLDWGLEKDVLLPYKEQTYKVKEGDEVLAAIYVDRSGRLAATMKVYPHLSTDSGYKKDDMVTGVVYDFYEPVGAYVAVDNKYSALIPKRELYGDIKIGDEVTARVSVVKPDGKLDLCLRQKAYLQMGHDAERLVEIIKERDGLLPFTDKASPELIKKEVGMSKNEFKRAVGNLLKSGRVEIRTDSIVLLK